MGFFSNLGILAVSAGINYLLSRRKPDLPVRKLGLLQDVSFPAQYVLGETRAPGLLTGYYEPKADSSYELYQSKFRDVHLAIAVSALECDSISGVYLNNLYYALHEVQTLPGKEILYRTKTRKPPYSSENSALFEIRACFAANGLQGALFRRVAGISSSALYLKGISWVHVILRQPNDVDSDTVYKWDSLPNIEFVMKGIKVPDPTSVSNSLRWTDSATDLRHWFMINKQGVPASDINASSVSKSQGITDAEVFLSLDGTYWRYTNTPDPPLTLLGDNNWSTTEPDLSSDKPILWVAISRITGLVSSLANTRSWDVVPYKIRKADGTIETLSSLPADSDILYRLGSVEYRSKRYSFNGIISDDQNLDDILGEMDYAWQGQVALSPNGEYSFEPGSDKSSLFSWNANNAISRSCTVGPSLGENTNIISSSIAASRIHDYQALELPVIRDEAALTRDGIERVSRLRAATLVDHPLTAGRLQATFLRRANRNIIYSYRFYPDDVRWWSVKNTDIITVSDSFYGTQDRRMVVANISWLDNGVIEATLVDSPVGAYADTIDVSDDLEDIPIQIDTVPAPTNVALSTVDIIHTDGSSLPKLKVAWDEAPFPAEIRFRAVNLNTIHGDEVAGSAPPGRVVDSSNATVTEYEYDTSPLNSVLLDIEWGWRWEVQVRLIGTKSKSPWSSAASSSVLASISETPQNSTTTVTDEVLFGCDAPLRKDISAIEISVGSSILTDSEFESKSIRYPVTPGKDIFIQIRDSDYPDIRLSSLNLSTVKVQSRFVTSTGAVSSLVTASIAQPQGTQTIPPDGHVVLLTTTPNNSMAGIKGRLFLKAVVNRAPIWGTIPTQVVRINSSGMVSLQDYVSDPDDPIVDLTFAASSSDTAKATVSISDTTLSIKGIAVGSVTITVTATDPDGLSASTTFTLTISASAPVAPANFSLTAGNREVTLQWSNPNDNSITKYQYSQDGGDWKDIPSSNKSTTSYIVTGLQNGTSYSFQVRAYNAGGPGASSGSLSATPVAALPAAPTGLSVSATGTTANLSWTDPNNDNIDHYEISRNNGPWTDIANSDDDTTSHAVSDLTNGSTYSFKIRAVSSGGNGPASTSVSIVIVPAAPSNLQAVAGNKQVTLSWNNPSDSSITRYQVKRDSGSWQDIANSGANTTSHVVTELLDSTAYTFQIRAVNSGGNSVASASVSVTTLAPKLYVIDSGTDRLYNINPADPDDTTGDYGEVGRLPTGLTSPAALTSHNGKLYAAGNGKLWNINPADPDDTTGDYGEIGTILLNLFNVRGIASHAGKLYVIDSVTDRLYNINPADPDDTTGDYGEVGRLPTGLTSPAALTSHNGKLYTAGNGKLWNINPADPDDTTGDYGEIGNLPWPTGLNLRNVTGLASLSGKLYGTSRIGGGETIDRLILINPADPDDITGDYGDIGAYFAAITYSDGLVAL